MRLPVRFIAGAAFGVAAGIIAAGAYFGAKSDAPSAQAATSRGPGGPGAMGRGGPAAFARGMTPPITVAVVEQAKVGRTIDAIGAARAARSVTLAAETTGVIKEILFKPGDRVKKGQPLLRLDDAEQRIALARAQAQYPIARGNRDRFAELLEAEAASRVEAETAFNAYKAAEADLRAAQFAVAQRTIAAPFDGVVGITTFEPGDYLRAGDIVASIDDDSSLIIEFTAPQEAAADLALGQKVTARLAAAGAVPIEGAISAIDSRVDQASRTLRVEAAFESARAEILPGAVYAVTTTSENADALAIPGLAAQWDRNGSYVWRLAPDGAVERISIVIAERRDEEALIEGALSAGDRVIVEGADRVRPGMTFPMGQSGAADRVGASGGVGAAAR